MLAVAKSALELEIPPGGGVILALYAVAYLVFGPRLPRLFDVLSMTVLGCGLGLLVSPLIPLKQWLVVIIGGIVFGALTAFFRRVAHRVLAAVVLGLVASISAAMAVGQQGFRLYVLEPEFGVQVPGPDLLADPVLAAAIVGALAGAALALLKVDWSERIVTLVQGAGLLVTAAAVLLGTLRTPASPPISDAYPLTLVASWLALAAVAVAFHRRWPPKGESGAEEPGPRRRRRLSVDALEELTPIEPPEPRP